MNNQSEFEFESYFIPDHLALKTGGGRDTFAAISDAHLRSIDLHCGLRGDMAIMELGCGIGRDAIPLTRKLTSQGSYIGTDIDKDSIDWCKENIAKRNPNFSFFYFDLHNVHYNPNGRFKTEDCPLPAPDKSIDLIILQSVFTHLFEDEIRFYMREFRRVLNDGGLVYATFFILSDEALQRINRPSHFLTFSHELPNGSRTNSIDNNRQAMGYTREKIERMARESGLRLASDPTYGSWSGRAPTASVDTGQDLAIFTID